jgi:flavin reductase (DIM6/NTAB) family NADH-FMN oxidoreductase RutF
MRDTDPAAALAGIWETTHHPMVVVTASAGGTRAGCLVGHLTQCSIDPLRVLVCLSRANRTHAVAVQAETLAVHHLGHDQRDLARLFGEETGDEVDKFARCSWRHGPSGTVVLDDVRHWWVGRRAIRVPLGDHEGFVLEPITVHAEGPYRQLDSTQVADLDAGHPRDEG